MAIELWTWNTPNGRKISAALEEMEAEQQQQEEKRKAGR